MRRLRLNSPTRYLLPLNALIAVSWRLERPPACESSVTAVFPGHHDSIVTPSRGHLLLSQEDDGGQGSLHNCHIVPDLSWHHGDSMLAPVRSDRSSDRKGIRP